MESQIHSTQTITNKDLTEKGAYT